MKNKKAEISIESFWWGLGLGIIMFVVLKSAFYDIAQANVVMYNESPYELYKNNGYENLSTQYDKQGAYIKNITEVTNEFSNVTVVDSGSTFSFYTSAWKIGKMSINSVNMAKDIFTSTQGIFGFKEVITTILLMGFLIAFLVYMYRLLLGG